MVRPSRARSRQVVDEVVDSVEGGGDFLESLLVVGGVHEFEVPGRDVQRVAQVVAHDAREPFESVVLVRKFGDGPLEFLFHLLEVGTVGEHDVRALLDIPVTVRREP